MILGIVTAVLFLLCSIKFLTRRVSSKKIDHLALRLHPYVGFALLACAFLHGILALRLRYQRPVPMTILGIVMFLGILVLSLSCILKGKNWLSIHRAAVLAVLVCLIVHVALGITSFNSYQKAVASLSAEDYDLDIGRIADGTYEGQYDAGYIFAKVKVSVKEGKLTSLELLEHRNEHGAPAERIIPSILKEQSLEADAISGATNSSKVIKAAIVNALSGQEKKK
ncbi:MAG: FMN-binding protein [Sphaerochaetaceae bacterium]